MRSEQVKYFLEAAACGSMSEVADKNFLTQPAVSTAIAKLEEELGVTLLVRTNHGVRLTEAGSKALAVFGYMEEQLMALKKELLRYKEQERHLEEGAIELATTLDMSGTLVDGAMQQFYQSYPNCIFSIREYDFMDILTVVGKGRCPFGVFCILDEVLAEEAVQSQLDHFGLAVEKLGSDRLMVGVRSDSSLAKMESLPLKKALSYPLVIYNSSLEACWHDRFLARYPHTKVVKTNRASYLTELVGQKGYLIFVLNGRSMRQMPNFFDGLTLVPIKEPLKVTLGILRRREPLADPLAEAFIAQLKGQLE